MKTKQQIQERIKKLEELKDNASDKAKLYFEVVIQNLLWIISEV